MKIIGQTKDGFLLEANAREIANLIGYYSDYSLPHRLGDKLQIGDQVNVAAMYGHLSSLQQAGKDIAAVVAKLRTAADLLETLPDPVTEVKVQPDPTPATTT